MKPDKVVRVHPPLQVEGYLEINGTLRVTPTHPLLVAGRWVEAGHVQPGDTLTAPGGQPVRIESLRNVAEKTTVYNFAVNPYETYVVEGVIVHNKRPPAEPVEPQP